MENSLILDALSKKGLQTYLTNRVFDKLFFPDFLDWERTIQLTVETLIGAEGNRVAADIVSYNASAPEKMRPVHDVMKTELPPIRIKRKMSETNLNDYFILQRLADDASHRKALQMIFNDVDFCMDGVLARLEWMTIQMLSYGKISLTTSNNAGVITETDIDFQLPSGNQEYIGSAGGTASANYYWTTGAKSTNDPITDIEAIVKEGKDSGVKFKYILMNNTKWYELRESAAVQAFVAPYLVYGGTAARRAPSVKIMNEALAGYGLPSVYVVDTRVTIEQADHTQTSTDPWYHNKYVTFIPEKKLGKLFWCPTAEEQAKPKQATHVKKGPILISKYSETDPVAEYTVGLLNAFPSWPSIDKAWILNTESHTAF